MGANKEQVGSHESASKGEKLSLVICQQWVESEAGWGVSPDGFSLHVSREALAGFVRNYWSTMPDVVPSVYSRPDGEPYATSISAAEYQVVAASKLGVRYDGTPPFDIKDEL